MSERMEGVHRLACYSEDDVPFRLRERLDQIRRIAAPSEADRIEDHVERAVEGAGEGGLRSPVPNRWEAFSSEERATVAMGLAAAAILELVDDSSGLEDMHKILARVYPMLGEISESMGEGGVDPELMAKLEEVKRRAERRQS